MPVCVAHRVEMTITWCRRLNFFGAIHLQSVAVMKANYSSLKRTRAGVTKVRAQRPATVRVPKAAAVSGRRSGANRRFQVPGRVEPVETKSIKNGRKEKISGRSASGKRLGVFASLVKPVVPRDSRETRVTLSSSGKTPSEGSRSHADPEPTRQPYDENTALRLYLKDAVEIDLLTPEDEIVLAKRIQAGDDVAREHMIRANLRLVVKIAREYEDFGLPLLDLINEGNIGLMHAVERFDPAKGAKLSTYAAWWIKQSIRRALSNQSKSIRLPIHVVQELARMKKAENRLETELGRPPTNGELAAELEASLEDIHRWREAAAIGATSLDAPLGSDPDSNRIADVVADENAVMPWSEVAAETDAELVRGLVTTLNAREQTILRRRFALDGGEPETLETIGASFGLTRERIRQLEAAALKKLRDRLRKREALQLAA